MPLRITKTLSSSISLPLILAAALCGSPATAAPQIAVPLAGPYEDPLQQQVPFGMRSYYLAPWRSYMDTWPASRFSETLGIQFNVDASEAEAVATLLGEAGFRSARIEVGWGGFRYDDPARLPEERARELTTKLQALQRHGIRPLILLNANSGGPVPTKALRVRVLRDAPVGARELFVESVEGVVPGRTGPRGQAYPVAYPLVTRADAAGGRLELSAPLKKAIPAGSIDLWVLRYAPFSGEVFAGGAPNPAAQETLDGWRGYVAAVCRYVRDALGTAAATDVGFDVEVWNEYTFGSQFLEDRFYYDPPRAFEKPIEYSKNGKTRTGHEILLPIVVDYVNDPSSGLPGVRVISGFSNQRPWDNGSEMWPGQTGFSRHYYTGVEPGDWGGGGGLLVPGKDPKTDQEIVDALGKSEGKPSAATVFVPTLRVAMPEWWHYAYKTEFITRDIQPIPGPWPGHGRFTHPGDGRPAQVWMTEFNLWRRPWAQSLMKATGASEDDPRLVSLMHETGAKALLRAFVFYGHKGVQTIDVYAAKAEDTHFAVLTEAFYPVLKASGGDLTPDVRTYAGRTLEVLGRVSALMRDAAPIETARPLKVERLVEHEPRRVFAGDGTSAHPDRWHRDDFAVLPYQLAADRYAVGYYVVTRNMVHPWQPERDALDPARYALPDQTFDLTLSNVHGAEARVSVYDPMTGRTLPAKVLGADRSTLTVRLPATDYPRFLTIDEAQPGPLIVGARVTQDGGEAAVLRFSTPTPAAVTVTWGPLPRRSGGGAQKFPAATQPRRLAIPSLPAGWGVRVTATADGRSARWPIWDGDVRGVARFAAPGGGTDAPAAPSLPRLPAGARPAAFTVATPGRTEGKPLLGDGPDAVEAEIRRVGLPEAQAASLLPALATSDRVETSVIDWNGARAWRIDLSLDPTAHPGLLQTRQRYLIAPLREGLAALVLRGTPEGFRTNEAVIDAFARGVTFS